MQSFTLSSLIHSVLVVEDSVPQRQHAVELCRSLGIEVVHEVENGRRALETLDTLDSLPDLLIVDLEMPEMDGVELIEALHSRGLKVPIVLVSSHEDALLDSVQGMGWSVVCGLHKPLTLKALQDALLTEYEQHPSLVVPSHGLPHWPVSPAMLRAALDAGEIVPHFQPKVDTQTGLLRGVEALARWNHPVAGVVAPDIFINMAEREGLIHPLTLSIMDQSFAQCANWNAHGIQLSVAVNLSPTVLDSAGIVAEICALQAKHDLSPAQVILEVTEGLVVNPYSAALGALARLRLKGFGLSIDDYGTGFSSMQQLARIPFTELKIDRSFVHGAHRRKSFRVILESALDMAGKLQLTTVAEGVETMEDLRLLQDFGCTTCQGWLIARAMPGDELPAWVKAHSARLPQLRASMLPWTYL